MSEILLIGLNHITAPVETRERITFPGDERGQVTRSILAIEGVQEGIIVSTCNRSEVILVAENLTTTSDRVIDFVGRLHGVDPESIREFLYIKTGSDAVRHVFRVSSSLDSMVVGEPQILGQIKESYSRAAGANATGPILNRLMHRAFFAAKRVRTETGIGFAAVSVAYVAVELAKKILGDLHDKSVIIIGAGEMAELAARHLSDHVERSITVFNRTYDNACSLASRLGGRSAPIDRLNEGLTEADVVVTSTGSCEPLITANQIRNIMPRRKFRPIFLIDIAIPRDVEPSVNGIDGVYLYNIDDLQSVAKENMGERRLEAEKGESIIQLEMDKFMKWTETLHSTPTIIALKDKFESIRVGEFARLNGKLSELSQNEREIVELITRSIINKIAHDPISFLKQTGLTNKQNIYLDLVQRLFRLDTTSENGEQGEKEKSEI